jgi:pimeloyl-ACP methyl ester carboxylesterase
MWLPILDALAPSLFDRRWACDAICIDHTGHGDSRQRIELWRRPVEWQQFCPADVLDAMATSPLAPRPRIGIGHSMGAAALVLTELAHPGTFDGLVLLEPILPPPGPLQTNGSLSDGAARRRASWPSKTDAHASLRSRGMFKAFNDRTFDAYIDHGLYEEGGAWTLKCKPEIEAEIYRGVGDSVWHRLGEVKCPVRLVVGGTSKHLDGWGFDGTVHLFQAMASQFAHADLTVLAGLGHFASFESPAHFAAVIASFLDAHQLVTARTPRL